MGVHLPPGSQRLEDEPGSDEADSGVSIDDSDQVLDACVR